MNFHYYEILSIPIPSENILKENTKEILNFKINYPVLYYYLMKKILKL